MTGSAWERLLDEFERELLCEPGSEPDGSWDIPAEPLPAYLADRARTLLGRQQRRIAWVEAELATAREHLDAVRRVPAAVSGASVYLDVVG